MNTIELLARGAVMGVGASALIDTWALLLRRAFGISSLDYRLLGRWLGHMRGGRFFHQRIAAAPSLWFERPLGWIAHYSIGVGFAFVLVLLTGKSWLESPTVWPALGVGIATIAAPWFIMQPAFGAGVAGSKTPRPWAGRLRNVGTHTVYGVGLYVFAVALTAV